MSCVPRGHRRMTTEDRPGFIYIPILPRFSTFSLLVLAYMLSSETSLELHRVTVFISFSSSQVGRNVGTS